MKTKRRYLSFVIVIAILCVTAPGKMEPRLPEYRPPILIGRAYPSLAATGPLSVVIVPLSTDPDKDSSDWKKLKAEVERKLTRAGIEIFVAREGITYKLPMSRDLKVQIETLKLEDSRQYVFRVQTSLARAVRLAPQSKFSFKADVWTVKPVMQVVSAEIMSAKVTNVALDQVEAFIQAWRAANPPGKQPSNTGDVSATGKEPTRPAAKTSTAGYKYAASKNSKVFHLPGCRFANQISPKNLVGYKSRNEAINAGKRPCKICKP